MIDIMPRSQFRCDKSGTSSIIGVMLVVVITVIVAAVIAAFAFGIITFGYVSHYDVTLTAKRMNSNDMIITLVGGPDIDKLNDVNPFTVKVNGAEVTLPSTFNKNVGSSAVVHGSYKSNVVVICHFDDGTDEVVMLGDI